MQVLQTQQVDSTSSINQFFNNLYGELPKKETEGRNTVYSLPITQCIRVAVDPYGGCHVEIPQQATIPEKLKEEITELSQFIQNNKLFDSLWIDVSVPSKANIFNICPDTWQIGNPEIGNVVIDTQKEKIRVWQWLNPDKICAIPAGATHNLGATAAVIDETAQKILLVQNERRKTSWEMPGGSFEPGKDRPESTLSTAIRECKEEAGLDPSNNPSSLIGQISFPSNQFAPAFNQVWKIVFNEGSNITPLPQPGETLQASWISFEDVNKGIFDNLKIGPEVQAAIRASAGLTKLPTSKEWMQLYFTN